MFRKTKVRSYEKGILFKDKEFKKILDEGQHWTFGFPWKSRLDVDSMRNPAFCHDYLDLIIKSGMLNKDAEVIELSENQRALVWIDDCFEAILNPGKHVFWKTIKHLRVEIVDILAVKLFHKEINAILKWDRASEELVVHRVEAGRKGLLFLDGQLCEVVDPGLHVFWKKAKEVKLLQIDTRESGLDIAGQEIITKDKVTLRLNGLVSYRVENLEKAVTKVQDFSQTLYREAQLALRAVVGTKTLDELLADKDQLAEKVELMLIKKAVEFGVKIIGFGIRDIILPGEMKMLLNKVVESQKAAEANLITRREETAAMRSQANTAKILATNPTLMRLRELELLEKVAGSSNLNIVCGEEGIADKVVKLI